MLDISRHQKRGMRLQYAVKADITRQVHIARCEGMVHVSTQLCECIATDQTSQQP